MWKVMRSNILYHFLGKYFEKNVEWEIPQIKELITSFATVGTKLEIVLSVLQY